MTEVAHQEYLIYDLKDQCGRCAEKVVKHPMVYCPHGLKTFPAAHNCPRFRYDWSDAK